MAAIRKQAKRASLGSHRRSATTARLIEEGPVQNNMPVLELQRYIAECAARISPTNAAKLGEFNSEKGVAIEFTDDKKFSIRVNLATNTIKLPVGALNYLWCASHLFIALYQAYVAAQAEGKPSLDTGGDVATSAAVDLFNWASVDLIVGNLEWPANGPRPSLAHQQGDLIHLTNEIFLAALAWILHHERAHIELEHPGGSQGAESIRQERDADRSASEWVMAGCANEVERQKRAFGIATGLLAMTLLDSPKLQIPEVKSHPPDIERLLDNLDVAQLGHENIVYSYSFVVLQFCIGQYDLKQAESNGVAEESVPTLEGMFRELAVRYHTRHRGEDPKRNR
ncbi:phage exclusion protein Lit family protein [Paraburkholderia agricolaris]|uniref:Phage exclusion protein Lit family protein n=1 Tax=Paraburkholderia agricolaris TaxID=2152888 RepID=A0ABW9A360_9BURK